MAALSEIVRLLASAPDRSPMQLSPLVGTISGTMAPIEAPQTFPRFELYLDDAFEWRWHYRVNNYKIIADSGEGYKNYGDAVHAIDLMRSCMRAPIHIGRD